MLVNFIQDMNAAWIENCPDDLEQYFHENMAIVKPGVGALAMGKEQCINSYRGFCSGSKLISYSESGHRADICGSTAVVNYRFEIEYEAGGARYHDVGFDIFVLVREGGKWSAVWRTMVDATK
jgi:hypothetical protein